MPEASAPGSGAGSRATALEWQIAWRHLRADGAPPWVRRVGLAALYLLLVGGGLWLYLIVALTPGVSLMVASASNVPAFDPVIDGGAGRLQQAFGLFAALSIGLGTVLLLFSLLARLFSVLATIVIFEVVLGCMAMVVVLSLMSGLEGDLRDKILAQRAHVRVSRADGKRLGDYMALTEAIAATEGVVGASPYLDGEVMVRSGLNRNAAVLYGVLPERMARASRLPELMVSGQFDALAHPELVEARDGGLGFGGEPPLTRPPLALPDVEDDPEGPEPEHEPEPAEPEEPAGDEGWEDPVEVLGLGRDAGDGTGLAALRALPPPEAPLWASEAQDELDGGDEGWEDPVEVLGLEPEAPPPARGETDPGSVGPAAEGAGRDAPSSAAPAQLDVILIGRELADELTVEVGARTQLITPVGRMTPAGRIPGVLATRVGGIFHTGMYEYDSKSVYAQLSLVQSFLRTGDRVSGVEVRLADQNDALGGKRRVERAIEQLGRSEELRVETWMDLNRNLFSAMFLEKLAMFIALSVVVVVASFGILASNLMSVVEKSAEIAVLKAMGSTDRLIQRVYWAEGLCVGLVGATMGIGLGLAICGVLGNFGIPGLRTGFYVEELPVTVSPLEVVAVGVVVMLIVWAFSLYPAFVASRMRPVDALRHSD